MNQHCLLCDSASVDRVEAISGADLEALYRRHGIALEGVPSRLQGLRCQRCGLGWFDPMYSGAPKLYEDLQRNSWYYEAGRPEFDFTQRLFRPGMRVLEVGCGEGNFLSRLSGARETLGLEFNDEAIRKCEARGLRVRKASIEDFAAESEGQFDLVCTFQVLEHVSRPQAYLDACSRCVAPGGLLVVSVPDDEGPMARMVNAWLNLPPHHVTRWSKRTFEWFAQDRRLGWVDHFVDPVLPEHHAWMRDQGASLWLADKVGLERKPVRNDLAWKLAVLGGKILGPLASSRFAGHHGHSITVALSKPRSGQQH